MTAEEKYKTLIRLRHKFPYQGNDVHLHHILPKCLKPKHNALVQLSLQEHTVAHWWLWKIARKKKKKLGIKVQQLYSAFNGLRMQWFTSRYRFTLEKEWTSFLREFEKCLFSQLESCKIEFTSSPDSI